MCMTAANADKAHAVAASIPPIRGCSGADRITPHAATIRAVTTAHATFAVTRPLFTYSSIMDSFSPYSNPPMRSVSKPPTTDNGCG